MTFAKASLVAMGFIGSMALGVWMAPYVTDREAARADVVDTTAVVAEPSVAEEVKAAEPVLAVERATVKRIAAVPPTAPDLQERLKPVLASGTDLDKAAAGFTDSEEFAVMAHLSRNTGVPFVLLKHRVLNEGASLGDALKKSDPDADVELELNRARAAARADIWAVG